jgi:hypothetical protein
LPVLNLNVSIAKQPGTDQYGTPSARKPGKVDGSNGVNQFNGLPFGPKGRRVHLIPPKHDNLAVSPGLLRNMSGNGNLAEGRPQPGSPFSTFHDTGTLGNRYKPFSIEGVAKTVPQHEAAEVGPQEHGSVLRSKIMPIVHTQFGASRSAKRESNTGFHEVGEKPPRIRFTRVSQKQGERTGPGANPTGIDSQSWQSKRSMTGHQGHDTTNGRWATAKRSASDAVSNNKPIHEPKGEERPARWTVPNERKI